MDSGPELNKYMKSVWDAGLGFILYDVICLLEKADDRHVGNQVKFRSKKYYEGYTDALTAVKECIKNRASRGDKNEQTVK